MATTILLQLNTSTYGSTYEDNDGNVYTQATYDPHLYYGTATSINGSSSGTFHGETMLVSVTFYDGFTTIGPPYNDTVIVNEGAFSGCTSLTSVNFSSTLAEIGGYAFYGCTALTSVAVPTPRYDQGDNPGPGIQSICDYAFAGCTSLVWVYIPKGATLGDIRLHDETLGITGQATHLFEGCTSLIKMGTNVYGDVIWEYFGTYNPTVRRILGWPCFLEDTKILCSKDGQETYLKVQDIRKGTLVKTILHGYLPVDSIGTTQIYNSGDDKRSQHRLYRCTQANYPELTEDLIMTGSHSILTKTITDVQREKTIELLGRIFNTDKHYRLMACIDERSTPYEKQGTFNIYHLALENDHYYSNYGIYANGLLVETCSKRYMNELSGMTLLG